ncbi:tetratricopeptide (TPR) repeat protein [Rhodoblastus acidophilus]|uniref:tetratricopeptide repeat protein n=1 Tax=Rhodoblastus acidophilus TaxID=1074 RepID=UPI0022257EB0|nr:tetratricopeptide repeat protein [Rhodoblastus acidophilus]MCW2283497.1 tetratricopeptide (TPR) repeat protein [Rhodoblastus acidophilus]MCW2332357.1 tetratricopeptide (TPR) repeat protein [Rhodoblastus acidophilus]
MFLRYVVEEEIAGRGHLIKEYSIAVDAYHENTDFDTAARSNIRVQARRVRESLNRYYAEARESEPIRISIPVGGYCPSFTLRADIEDPGPPSEPTGTETATASKASAQPAANIGWTGRAAVLGWIGAAVVACLLLYLVERVINAGAVRQARSGLPRMSLDHAAFDDPNARSAAKYNAFAESLKADLRMYGTLSVTENADESDAADFRLKLATLDPSEPDFVSISVANVKGDVVFAEKQSLAETEGDGLAAAASGTAAILSRLNGPLYTDVLRRRPSAAVVCVTNAAAFVRHPVGRDYRALTDCLDDTARQPGFEALAGNLLATLLITLHHWGLENEAGAQIVTLAENLTVRALGYNHQMVAGFGNLTDVYHDQERDADALALADQALAKNPGAPEILYRLGRIRMDTGQLGEGVALIKRAMRVDPSPPSWVLFYLFLEAFARDDFATAAAYANNAYIDEHPSGVLAKIIVSRRRGDAAAVTTYERMLNARFPEFARDIEGALSRSRVAPPLTQKLLKALKDSGAASASALGAAE